MTENMITRKPQCMVIQSQAYALTTGVDMSILPDELWIPTLITSFELRGYSCSPYIRYNGEVILGETYECNSWFNVKNYDSDKKNIKSKLLSWIPCNQCKCCKRFRSEQLQAIRWR